MDQKPLFSESLQPLRGQALDFIKIYAAIAMVIDHINVLFMAETRLDMMLIGRATFPLFCFALASALHKKPQETRFNYAIQTYMPRLLLLGAICTPITFLAWERVMLNVIFTLALSAGFASVSMRMKDSAVYVCTLLAAGLMYFPSINEFGTSGIVLPALMLMAMQGKKAALPFLLLTLFFINAENFGETLQEHAIQTVLSIYILIGLAASIAPYAIIRMASSLRQDGRFLSKYALHIFYPGHLLILLSIKYFVV